MDAILRNKSEWLKPAQKPEFGKVAHLARSRLRANRRRGAGWRTAGQRPAVDIFVTMKPRMRALSELLPEQSSAQKAKTAHSPAASAQSAASARR